LNNDRNSSESSIKRIFNFKNDISINQNLINETKPFRNGCLIILPCRVGMTKVEKCYIKPIK
jgi:hypothetical protein